MAEQTETIARPYARAAFAIARDAQRLDEWSRLLRLLGLVVAVPEVARFLASPTVPRRDKTEQLAGICAEQSSDEQSAEHARRFIEEIIRNDRWPLLAEVSEQFERLRAEEQLALDVEVSSAYELSDAERRELAESLRRRFGREIRLHQRTDSALLGGIVIRAGDTVIDASVRGRLRRLSESLQPASLQG